MTASGPLAALADKYRLRRVSFGLVAALVVAMVVIVVTGEGPWGDFNVFWAIGGLVREDPMLVLDPAAQAAAVAPWYGEATAPFPYPPIVSLAMVPLHLLPLDVAYLLAFLVLSALAGLAAWLTCDLVGVDDPVWRQVAVAGTVVFAPVVRATVSGQNATITLFVLVLGWWLRDQGHPLWAGIALGALWAKPQYAIPVLLLLLVGRWWRTGATMAASAVALWTVNAVVYGVDWLAAWWQDIVMPRDGANILNEVASTISPVEYLRPLLGDPAAIGVAVALGLGAAAMVRRADRASDRLAITGLALVLTAPHALAYEGALVVPALGTAARAIGPRAVAPLAFWWASGVVTLLPVSPLLRIAWVVGIAAWLWRETAGT